MSMLPFPPRLRLLLWWQPHWDILASPDFRSWISWKSSWITTPLPKKSGFKRGFIWPFRHLVHKTSESSIFIGASQSLLSSKVMTPKAKGWEIWPGNFIFLASKQLNMKWGHVDGMWLDFYCSHSCFRSVDPDFWISWWASEKERLQNFCWQKCSMITWRNFRFLCFCFSINENIW